MMNRATKMLALLPLLACAAGSGAAPGVPDDWPQWRGPSRDGVWKEQGVVAKFDTPQLAPRWRVPVSNGYSGPTVADGRVYVTDRVTEPQQQERVHCFEWKTGKPVWTHAYPAVYGEVGYPNGPRASVTLHDGRAYSLGAVGHLYCFDAATGAVRWSKDLQKEYEIRLPVWGLAAAPLVEGDLVITHIGGANDACLVAFDRKTGQERWRALPDRPSYSPPVIVEQAGKRVLVCWTGDRVVGLDPQSGKLHWEYPFPARMMVVMIAAPVVNRDRLFVTSVYEGSLMLRLKQDTLGVEKLWERRSQNAQNTEGLHSLISTPLFLGDSVYGINFSGELRALDAKTGDRLWETQAVVPRATWATAHLVQKDDQAWLFNEKGQLIIARLTPQGYAETSRTQLIKPTLGQLRQRGGVAWAHPAFAYKHVFARNDEELICASLEAAPAAKP